MNEKDLKEKHFQPIYPLGILFCLYLLSKAIPPNTDFSEIIFQNLSKYAQITVPTLVEKGQNWGFINYKALEEINENIGGTIIDVFEKKESENMHLAQEIVSELGAEIIKEP